MPGVWGVSLSVRLTRAAWLGGAAVDEPLVARLFELAGVEAPAVSLDEAARLAPLDFRYPWREARAFWSPGRKGPVAPEDIRRSHEQVLRAIRLAPCYAPPRYQLCATALSLGEGDLADRSALAALRLAPLHLDLRSKVADYFRMRFRETGSEKHLNGLLRSMGRKRGEVVTAVLDRLTLTYEEMLRAFERAGIEKEESISTLEEAGRWDWAIRLAAGGSREAEVRLRYAANLLGRGAVSSAFGQASSARELEGESFRGWLVLGDAALRSGRTEVGLEALERALDSGAAGIADVARALRAGSLSPDGRERFWAARLEARPRNRQLELELARALIDGEKYVEARQRLAPLEDLPEYGAEAHYLLALVFRDSGSPSIALRHARRAAEKAPDDQRYRALVRGLEKEVR